MEKIKSDGWVYFEILKTYYGMSNNPAALHDPICSPAWIFSEDDPKSFWASGSFVNELIHGLFFLIFYIFPRKLDLFHHLSTKKINGTATLSGIKITFILRVNGFFFFI